MRWLAALGLFATTAYAQAPGEVALQPPGITAPIANKPNGRDTDRIMLAGGIATFGDAMSPDLPGPAILVSKPLWLGTRYRFFQWAANATALAAYARAWGGADTHAQVDAGPEVGFNLYLGSVFSFEYRFGAIAMAELGERSRLAPGLSSSGGYVFRFWDDDRKRLKLWTVVHIGLATSADAPVGAFLLAYEEPW